ncbi:MAG: hypothetical protein ABI041_11910, partial [Bdellovibrionia bacterium]
MNIILILLLLLSATEGRCSSFQEILRSFEAMTVNNHASTGPQVVQRKAPPPVPPKPKNLRADAGLIPDAVNPFDIEDSDAVSELSVESNPFDDCYECEPVQVQEKPSVLKAIHMFENLSTTGGSRRSMDEVKENPSVSESQCPSFIKGNVA